VISLTPELLARYDRPGPRYTSYPTAVEFSEDFGPAEYAERLEVAGRKADGPLSLYVHLPFCDARCSFCGCHVVIARRESVSHVYLQRLIDEAAIVADHLGERRTLVQYHWGGGTPTYYSTEDLAKLHRALLDHFTLAPDAEVALEVDPRVTTKAHLEMLRELGFNRLSLGVQDLDPTVQELIGRNQTWEETRSLYDEARRLGFESINIDLIYGLPGQDLGTMGATLERTLEMRPDRLAVYSFAYVPWVKPFMGYTTKRGTEMVALGSSGISDVAGAYAQNHKRLNSYYQSIEAGELPVERGVPLSDDDRIRRHVITELMCNSYLSFADVEQRFGISFTDYFANELETMTADGGPVEEGMATVGGDHISATELGTVFIRNVAMTFDTYLKKADRDKPVFSRTV
jgi:oxygen-independent coproporphyrinogen-3 oxidase